jgi:hypothetical protein
MCGGRHPVYGAAMEISNYYVPVALILPLVAILGILFVTLGMSYVLRRRRSQDPDIECDEKSSE